MALNLCEPEQMGSHICSALSLKLTRSLWLALWKE